MSINLNISSNLGKLDIYQTPTYVSYMCVVDGKGDLKSRQGKKALRSIQIYLQWVESIKNETFANEEDAKARRDSVNEHINTVKEWIEESAVSSLLVWVS